MAWGDALALAADFAFQALGCAWFDGDSRARAGARSRQRRRRDPLGRQGETVAATFLRRRGYRVVRRNMRLAAGEIDLVAIDPDRRTVVVVEVKARRAAHHEASTSNGRSPLPPEVAISGAKSRKLLSLAAALRARPRWRGFGVRIDVVAVEWPERGPPVVRHHVNAVTR